MKINCDTPLPDFKNFIIGYFIIKPTYQDEDNRKFWRNVFFDGHDETDWRFERFLGKAIEAEVTDILSETNLPRDRWYAFGHATGGFYEPKGDAYDYILVQSYVYYDHRLRYLACNLLKSLNIRRVYNRLKGNLLEALNVYANEHSPVKTFQVRIASIKYQITYECEELIDIATFTF